MFYECWFVGSFGIYRSLFVYVYVGLVWYKTKRGLYIPKEACWYCRSSLLCMQRLFWYIQASFGTYRPLLVCTLQSPISCVRTCTRTCTRAHTRKHTHTHIHTRTHAHTHTYTGAHAHTSTYTNKYKPICIHIQSNVGCLASESKSENGARLLWGGYGQ